jgi:two-component system alkaline phosphatase synthesis response regulator PhoP
LAERIRGTRETSDLPVIMLSAKGFELSPHDLRERFGIRCLMAKPFSPRELFARVEAVLNGEEVSTAPMLTARF